MHHRDIWYTLIGKAEFDQRAGFGFTSSNISEDGDYCFSDRGESVKCLDVKQDIVIPSFFPETYPVIVKGHADTGNVDGNGERIFTYEEVVENRPLTDNHPSYNQEQVEYILLLEASAEGASDGWIFPGMLRVFP